MNRNTHPLADNPYVKKARSLRDQVYKIERQLKKELALAALTVPYKKGDIGYYDLFRHEVKRVCPNEYGELYLDVQRIKADGTRHPSYSKKVYASQFVTGVCEQKEKCTNPAVTRDMSKKLICNPCRKEVANDV